jgi:hypothetical protein
MCNHNNCIVSRVHTIECVICGRKMNQFTVTDHEGYTTILDTFPICEYCIAEFTDIEELI